MNRRKSFLHFIISMAFLSIGLFIFSIKEENGDVNSASMYLVVFGWLSFAFWLASYLIIVLMDWVLKNRNLELIAYVMPVVVFGIVLVFIDDIYIGLFLVLAIIAAVTNLLFYFIDGREEN